PPPPAHPPVPPPLFVIAWAPAVPIDGADEHDGADGSLPDQFPRLPYRRVMAMIEASLKDPAGSAGGGDHLFRLGEISPERFLAQHVFARFEARDRDGRQRAIKSRH